jgi:hypothetical protein
LFFTCTTTNQVVTYTSNTRQRVNPHSVVNHSSLRSDHAPALGHTHVLTILGNASPKIGICYTIGPILLIRQEMHPPFEKKERSSYNSFI